MSTSVIITLDTRRIKKKKGKYPIKLLVTFNCDPKRYQTIYDLTQDEFDNLSASRVSEKMKVIRDNLKQVQRNAEDVVNSLQPFNYREFEKDYILNNPFFRQRKS